MLTGHFRLKATRKPAKQIKEQRYAYASLHHLKFLSLCDKKERNTNQKRHAGKRMINWQLKTQGFLIYQIILNKRYL